jgi:hypothetical protein
MFLLRKPERDQSEDLSVDGRIEFNWKIGQLDRKVWTAFI